jgi:hypothetical protein
VPGLLELFQKSNEAMEQIQKVNLWETAASLFSHGRRSFTPNCSSIIAVLLS